MGLKRWDNFNKEFSDPDIAGTLKATGADPNILVSGPAKSTGGASGSTGGTSERGSMPMISRQLTLPLSPTMTLSQADFLARAFRLLEKAGGSPTLEELSFLRYAESLGLRDLRIFSLRMLETYCQFHIHRVLKNGQKPILMRQANLLPGLKGSTRPSPELKDGFFSRYSTRFGNWGMTSSGRCLTARISESRRIGSGCSLSDILEELPDPKYFLSDRIVERIAKWRSQENPLHRVLPQGGPGNTMRGCS